MEIVILSICVIVAFLLYINSCYKVRALRKELNTYKNTQTTLEEIEKSGRKAIPVIYNDKTYFIYQDSNMSEAIKMIDLKPNTTYYDRTPNSEFNVSYIDYRDYGSDDRLILSFENNVLKSVKNI